MKLKTIFSTMLVLAASTVAVSCSDDDAPEAGPVDGLPAHRMFILNEGSYALNNAGIAFYAPDNSDVPVVDDIFYEQNDMHLGDTGQDIIMHGDKVFVSVYGSNYLARLDKACVEEARVSFAGDADLGGGIRYLAAKDGYIYASFHGGVVAKINASTLRVEGKLNTGESNLEGVAIVGDRLYVANSYSQDGSTFNYYKDVYVIDPATFTLKETLTVTENPNKLVSASGKVFLISQDYSRESYVLQLIDPAASNRVSELGYATHMAAGDGVLYLIDSRNDYSSWPTVSTVNTFSYYDIRAGRIVNSSFLRNAPAELASSLIYMITVDPTSGDIYIGVTHYTDSNGDIYRFSKDGTYVGKFDCGGQNPKAAAFC